MNHNLSPAMDSIVSFGVTCWPGRGASSSVYEVSQGHPALSIYLDPLSLLVTIPPTRHGPKQMAAFCRQLAGAAGQLAKTIDPFGGA